MADSIELLPGNLPLTHYKGDTFDLQLEMLDANDDPIDLTQYVNITMQIKKKAKSDEVIASLDLTDGITISGVDNRFLDLKKVIDVPAYEYVYDLQFKIDNDNIFTYLAGTFIVEQDVTRLP